MTAKYSPENVNAMISSVYSNKEIIDSMLKLTAENEKNINTRLSAYSQSGTILESESIDMYRNYVLEKENMLAALEDYQNEFHTRTSIELYKSSQDYSALHVILDKLNTMQIKIMELLCRVIGISNRLLGCI